MRDRPVRLRTSVILRMRTGAFSAGACPLPSGEPSELTFVRRSVVTWNPIGARCDSICAIVAKRFDQHAEKLAAFSFAVFPGAQA